MDVAILEDCIFGHALWGALLVIGCSLAGGIYVVWHPGSKKTKNAEPQRDVLDVLIIATFYDSSLLEKSSGIARTVSGLGHGAADGDEAPERKLVRELYNELSPVSLDFMAGQWRGTDVPCAHPLNGVLKGFRWHGKTFHAPDKANGTYHVDPLVMQSCFSNRLFPLLVPPFLLLKYGLFMPGLRFLAPLLSPIAVLLATKHPQATLQLREYEGKVSAAMVYNTVPIVDSFRKLDENTVLGCMVMESEPLSYYFTLDREGSNVKNTMS